MTDCIALIGSTGFFEVFEACDESEKYAYWHFPWGTYHWSLGNEVHYLGGGMVLTLTGLRITRDIMMRDLVRTAERL